MEESTVSEVNDEAFWASTLELLHRPISAATVSSLQLTSGYEFGIEISDSKTPTSSTPSDGTLC